jgi:hypothetical protein
LYIFTLLQEIAQSFWNMQWIMVNVPPGLVVLSTCLHMLSSDLSALYRTTVLGLISGGGGGPKS